MTKASQTPPRPELFSAALAASLRLQRERQRLDRVAAERGVVLLFLKAAWADPVLYGNTGQRLGSDIDVLIANTDRSALSAGLEGAGYRRSPRRRDHAGLGEPKAEGWLAPEDDFPIDLHWALANPPWFTLPAEPLIKRRRDYPSLAGPITSLAVEDQVVHAAAHSASQALDLDERHFEDIRRLAAQVPIDWPTVASRAADANVELAFVHLCGWLVERGVAIPASVMQLGAADHARLRLVRRLTRIFSERRPWIGARILGIAILARRETDLGRLVGRWGRVRLAELRRNLR